MDGKTAWRLMTVLAVMAVPGCGVFDALGLGDDDDDDDGNEIEGIGVVEFVQVEGGCWSIRSENEVFEPINLPEGLRIDGLEVEFEGEIRTDVASICQIGPIIDLEEIELISGS